MTKTTTKRIFFLVNFMLAGLILWTATSIVAFNRSTAKGKKSRSGNPSVAPVQRPPLIKNKAIAAYSLISAKNIFQTAKLTAPPPEMNEDVELHETELNLELKGTVVGGDRHSYAVILDMNTNLEKFYAQGDFVMGARIARIQKSRVILDLEGEMEALMLEHQDEPGLQAGPVRKMPPRRVTPFGRTLPQFRAPG